MMTCIQSDCHDYGKSKRRREKGREREREREKNSCLEREKKKIEGRERRRRLGHIYVVAISRQMDSGMFPGTRENSYDNDQRMSHDYPSP